ncbi:UNVERIFIED_CONTAM: hypothetical protein FKN15_012391 [Acipenser sinensis]
MSELNKEVIDLVWGRLTGNGVSDTVFCRWTQGFVFSETEPTALEQFQGGPCAVIAAVQAFLLKNVLFNCENSNWRECSEEKRKAVLCNTLSEILETACFNKSKSYSLVTWSKEKVSEDNASISDSHPESSHHTMDEEPSALAAEELGFERFHTVIQ